MVHKLRYIFGKLEEILRYFCEGFKLCLILGQWHLTMVYGIGFKVYGNGRKDQGSRRKDLFCQIVD